MSDFLPSPDVSVPPSEDSTDRVKRSTVAFPYISLDEAIGTVSVVHEKSGRECELAQLAAWLGTTVTSSKFRSTVSAARMFGLVDRHAKTVSLTELGAAIIDPDQREQAAVEAFLRVPLYREVYDIYSERLLPGDSGFEKELEKLGVTEKSAAKARQVLQRSASHAGFFQSGRDRLVRPASAPAQRQADVSSGNQAPTPVEEEPDTSVSATEPSGPTDPLLRGLWSKLPSSGAYSAAEQKQWLEMAKLALQMVYGSGETEPQSASLTASESGKGTATEDTATAFAEPNSA